MQKARASKAIPHEDAIFDTESEEVGDPTAITPERVLGDLDIVLRKARRKDELSPVDARYFDYAGRNLGLWGARTARVGGKEPKESKGPRSLPGPAEVAGLTRRSGE